MVVEEPNVEDPRPSSARDASSGDAPPSHEPAPPSHEPEPSSSDADSDEQEAAGEAPNGEHGPETTDLLPAPSMRKREPEQRKAGAILDGLRAVLRRVRLDVPIAAVVALLSAIALYFIFVVPFRKRPHDNPAEPSSIALPAPSSSVAAPEPTVSSPTSQRPALPHEPQWRVSALAQDKSIELVESEVGKRPLVTALGASGVGRTEAQRILNAFRGVRNFNRTQPAHTFIIARKRGKPGHVAAFEYIESPSQVWQARENDAGTLEGKKLELAVEERKVDAAFAVEGDLRESVKKAGFDPVLLESLDDALDGHAELSEVRPGARLRIAATEERIDGAFSRYTDINAVEYFPANAPNAPIRVYHFVGDRRARGYYDAAGKRPYRGGWRSPLPGARISSRFNPHRKHPVLHIVIPHTGVDFAAPSGTPVYSSADGVVIHASDGGPCGNMVQIQHKNGLITAYCHLSRFAAGLHTGESVEARQLVGYVGQTGRATGPHLHFAVKRNGVFMDPLSLKLDGVRVLPAFARAEFDEDRKRLDAELDGIALPAAPNEAAAPAAADAGAPKQDENEEIFDELDPAAH